jgi:hypothetical protein
MGFVTSSNQWHKDQTSNHKVQYNAFLTMKGHPEKCQGIENDKKCTSCHLKSKCQPFEVHQPVWSNTQTCAR